jgi:hypothetical protein
LALLALALGASVSGCELIVRFDESKLMDVPAVDAPRADAASEAAADAEQDAGDATMAEASTDAAAEAAVDAADVLSDGFVSRPDAIADSTPDASSDANPDSAAEPSPEPTVEAGVEPTPDAGVDASDDAAPMGDAAMDASTD